MMGARRDDRTLDLLGWEPPDFVQAFQPHTVKAPNFRDQMALAVARTLADSPMPREEIAARMSVWMGEKLTVNMLNNYASQGCAEHTISANRLEALCAITGDTRPLQLMAEALGCIVIEKKWQGAIREAQLVEKAEQIAAARKLARRQWQS